MYYTKESTPPVKVNIYAIRKSGYEVEFYTFFFSKSANMKKENKIQKMTLEKCRLCLKKSAFFRNSDHKPIQAIPALFYCGKYHCDNRRAFGADTKKF